MVFQSPTSFGFRLHRYLLKKFRARGALAEKDEFTFLCGHAKQDIHKGKFLGPKPDAFRIDENGISGTWVDYFNAPPPARDQAARETCRARTPGKSGVFPLARVERILEVAQKLGVNAPVVHDPEPNNIAHSLIKNWPDDTYSKLALAKAFDAHILAKEVPGLFD